MGRPNGSKNKSKMVTIKRGRGRPKGSKNKFRTLADMGDSKTHFLPCSGDCGRTVEAAGSAVSVLCHMCTQKIVPYEPPKMKIPGRKRGRPRKSPLPDPTAPKRGRGRPRIHPKVVKKTTGFGRGWAFKIRFVAPNGDVYSRGKLIKKV